MQPCGPIPNIPPLTRILIADDVPSGRDLLRAILERVGCIIEEAVDGVEAVEKAPGFRPHLVILDIHMPRMDGLTAAALLRQNAVTCRTPIVALTAAITQTDPEEIAAAGFSAYLVKPIAPARLRECVNNLLAARPLVH